MAKGDSLKRKLAAADCGDSYWLSAFAGSNPAPRIMKQATLCYVLDGSKVLLGMKKIRFGVGEKV